VTGTGLPSGYAARLQKLLHAEWRGGESCEKFAQRLGVGSSRTLKSWLALDFKIEPEARKLRQLARYLGWQYWELVRYLDTGYLPERPAGQQGALLEPLATPSLTPQMAKSALRGTFEQLRSLADTMQQWLDLLPNAPAASPIPPASGSSFETRKLESEAAAPTRDRPYSRLPRPSLPEAMKLPQLIDACLERSGISDKRLAERIDDVGYYTSRDTINPEIFAAARDGCYVPSSEKELDALADVVDRDREYFTGDEWMRAWIASIYARDCQLSAPPANSPDAPTNT